MSFGVGIGDIFAILRLATSIRRRIGDAPAHYAVLSTHVRELAVLIQDADAKSRPSLTLELVVRDCTELLAELKEKLERNSALGDGGDESGPRPRCGHREAAKKLWRRLALDPADVHEWTAKIQTQVGFLNTASNLASHHAIGASVDKLVSHNEDHDRAAVLQWISPIDGVTHHNDLAIRCQPDSRRWLFESDQYRQWLVAKPDRAGGPGSILFCPGMPGAGKTFTVARVVSSLLLQSATEGSPTTLTTYFYCDYRSASDMSPTAVLGALLRVSLQQRGSIPEDVLELHHLHHPPGQPLGKNQVFQGLLSAFTGFDRVNVVVDALDELTDAVRRPLIGHLLDLGRAAGAHLIVTSRDMGEIRRPFADKGALVLDIRASDEDVCRFLRDYMSQLPGFVDRDAGLQDTIVDDITRASDGMFLLAELHLRSLVGKKSKKAVRMALAQLATGSSAYDDAYETAMNRIQAQVADSTMLAKQALMIVAIAQRTLTAAELVHALSIEPDGQGIDEENVPDIEDVISVCAGLLVVDTESNVIRLVHKSTQEYFERHRDRWFPDAETVMAGLCLRAVGSGDGLDLPFMDYARGYRFHHALVAEKRMASLMASGNGNTITAQESLVAFNFGSVINDSIRQMAKELPNPDKMLIQACDEGRYGFVNLLLEVHGFDLSQGAQFGDLEEIEISGFPTTDSVPLTIAAARGDDTMVAMLLQYGANPNVWSSRGQTALYLAARSGRESLVSLLLEHPDIQPDYLNFEGNKDFVYLGHLYSALHIAALLGNTEIVKLLAPRADRNLPDRTGRTPLWHAARAGHLDIVSELLQWSDVDVDYASDWHNDIIDFTEILVSLQFSRRPRADSAAVAEEMIQRDKSDDASGPPDFNPADFNSTGLTALEAITAYCEYGGPVMGKETYRKIWALLSKKSRLMSSPRILFRAVCDGNYEVVSLLLKAHCDEYANAVKTLSLALAIYKDWPLIVDLLIAHVDVLSKFDNRYFFWPLSGRATILHACAYYGKHAYIEKFLTQDPTRARIGALDSSGSSALGIAKDREEIRLRSSFHKYVVDQVNFDDAESMFGHSIGYQDASATMLKHSGVPPDFDVNRLDSSGLAILHHLCTRGVNDLIWRWVFRNKPCPVELAVALEIPGIDVNIVDGQEGMSPLLWAVEHTDVRVVRALLRHRDILVNSRDRRGNTALLVACQLGVLEPSQHSAKAMWDYSRVAFEHMRGDILKLLLKHPDIDRSAVNEKGDKAIDLARRWAMDIIVSLLEEQLSFGPNWPAV